MDEVTAWAQLTVQDERQQTRSVLVKMRLIGDPPDRLDAVLASQIDSTDKFLALIRLLLTLEDEVMGAEVTDSVGEGVAFFGDAAQQGLFESLVDAEKLVHRYLNTPERSWLKPGCWLCVTT